MSSHKKIVGQASPIILGSQDTAPKMVVGSRIKDNSGSEYVYVGASGVGAGAPIKVTTSLSLGVVGTAESNVVGFAVNAFPSTGYTYGLAVCSGPASVLVPSGTAAGTMLVPGNGTTKAATGVPSLTLQSLATAANLGTAIDVYIF